MARLPQPGGDQGSWGEILNEYLRQAHSDTGLLSPNSVGTVQIQDNAVSSSKLADQSVSEAKLHTEVQDKLNAISAGGATNLSTSATTTTVTIASDTGDDATISAASSTVAGVMPATDKIKLDNIANGATVNSTDATLLARTNHTGTQAISTVAGLQTALDSKQSTGDYATNSALTSGLATKPNTNTVVTLTGAQTVAGVKTFSNAPVVPNGSFTIDTTSGLRTALDNKIDGQNGANGLWIGSQAQYDAIGSKSATTLYVINDA